MLEKIGLPAKPSLRGNNWVVDASHCQGCNSQFTFINRKHHCRRCGGLFCNTCTQQRMVLRGQGDSPVRICDPCKKLEEAARFELRHGRKTRAIKGISKMMSMHEDEVLNHILGNDGKESLSSGVDGSVRVVSSIQRATSSPSCPNDEGTSHDGQAVTLRSLSTDESNRLQNEMGSASPEELRQRALDEKRKYKILKGEGKPEEALRAFKRGKDLERQAEALEIYLRKSRRKAMPSGSIDEIQNQYGLKDSGRKNKLPQTGKEKDDLATELRELGWSDMDLHDADKKSASISLEGELTSLLGEFSKRTDTNKDTPGIDKSEVVAHKKRALMLKREGNLAEAKEELKRAKLLEKQLEEQEILAEAEDSDDELSSLLRSMDSSKQDDFPIGYEDRGFDFDHLMGVSDDLGVDSNFEVTDEDMEDPEIAAALESLGWTTDSNHPDDIVLPAPVPIDKESLSSEILSLKREALNQKRAGNVAEAMAQLKKAKLLERDLESLESQDDKNIQNPSFILKDSASRGADKLSKSSEVDEVNVNKGMDLKPAPKSKLMIQKELLGLKKKALALRREGRLDEAEEELKKGSVLENQLAEMDNNSKAKVSVMTVASKDTDLAYEHPGLIRNLPLGEEGEDVTDKDLHDPTYLSLLRNLGWKDEDNELVNSRAEPSKKNDNQSVPVIESFLSQTVSSIPAVASRRSKAEIQRELLGLKRKALTLRRQGKTEEAEEVLRMTKELEDQMMEIDAPKTQVQFESNRTYENIMKPPLRSGIEEEKEDVVATDKDMHDPSLLSMLNSVGWQDEEHKHLTRKENSSVLIADSSVHSADITAEKGEEMVNTEKKPHIHETNPVQGLGLKTSQSSLQQEILAHKRKAVALKREGKLTEAKEELRQVKLLEKSQEEDNPQQKSDLSSDVLISSKSNVPSVEQKEQSSLDLAPKPLSGRERFKLQQESLGHKRKAMKLRREGRMEEAEAEFELAKTLESQLEELTSQDSTKRSVKEVGSVDDVGVEDLLDPQLLSALKAIGLEDVSTIMPAPQKAEPAKLDKSKNSNQERIQLEEQIKTEKVKAVNLKRSGKQAEALDALRRAKVLEKKLNSLATQ